MKKYIVFILLFTQSFYLNACDLCGCFMGITPYDNQSSIGLYHRYRCFSAYKGQEPTFFPKSVFTENISNPISQYPILKHGDHGGHEYSKDDFETYSVYELRAKYFIHKRIELNGILPYNINRFHQLDSTYTLKSIGDINLFAGYHLVRPDEYKKIQQRLILGAGIKLPAGHYYLGYEDDNRFNLLVQPGTGSIDYMLYLNYVLGIKKWGFNTNISYRLNGENWFNEKIGNSITNYTNIFYKIKAGNFIIIPSAQFYYEYTPGLYINDVLQDATKMNILMAGPGLDLFYKNIGFNSNFQFTMKEELHESNLQSVCKIMFGISYNFNQKKYLSDKLKAKNQNE